MAQKRANQYDRIFKENMEVVIPRLVNKLLGISFAETEELPDDLLHTKERKPDVLKKITDTAGNTFVLHLEIQLADEPDMVYRMADYDLMLHRKYRLPVEQYVVYIGNKRPTMPTRYTTRRHQFEFPLIVVAEIDYHFFLQANEPDEVVFAILGNFRHDSPTEAVRNILNRIYVLTKGDFNLQRHLVQLRILSQLRKLESITETIMDSVSQFFKEDKDFLFIKGLEQGINQGLEQGISEKTRAFTLSLIANTSFDDRKIAELVGVTTDYVNQLRDTRSA